MAESRGFHLARRPPTLGCRFVVAGDRRIGDREYKDGDAFPYQKLGLVYYDAVILWMANRLKVAAPATALTKPKRKRDRA